MIHSNALVQKLFYVPFLWKSACSVSQNKTHSKHTGWVGSLEIIWTSNKLSIIFSRIGEPYFHRGGRSPSQVQRGDNLKTQKKKVHSWQMCFFFQFKLSLTFFILKQKTTLFPFYQHIWNLLVSLKMIFTRQSLLAKTL